MNKQEGISEWSRLYNRQISETEYDEICQNLSGFIKTIHEWDKEDKESNGMDKSA